MGLLDGATSELLDRFASAEPTPGGGSAAALAGALGAALGWAREAGARLRSLVDDDTAAYDAVVAGFRLPKGSDEEKASRKAAIAAAMERATEVPLRTAEACLVVLRASQEAAVHGNANALSDARTGAALAWAGLVGAAENVRINSGPAGDSIGALDAIVAEGRDRAARLGLL